MSDVALLSPYATFSTPDLQDHARNLRLLLDLPTASESDHASLGYLLSTYEVELAERAMLREAAAVLAAAGADLGDVDGAPRLSCPDDDAPVDLTECALPDDPLTLQRMIVAERHERRAEHARRVAAEHARDEATDEARRTREENTLIVNAVCNPNLDGLGTAAIRTVMYVAHERRMGRAREDGSVRAPSRKIGDDWRPDDDHAPILPASTAHAKTKRLAMLGLLDRQLEPATIRRPKRTRGQGGKWVTVRDEAGKIEYEDDVAEVTFLNIPGQTIADMLKPFALFGDPPEKTKRGGDRRSTKFRAMRDALTAALPCPHCGKTDCMRLVCVNTGAIVTPQDLADAAELAAIAEAAVDQAIKLETPGDDGAARGADPYAIRDDALSSAPATDRAFRICTPKNVTRPRSRHRAFKFETHGERQPVEPPWLDDAPLPEDPPPDLLAAFGPPDPWRQGLRDARHVLTEADHATDRDAAHRAHGELTNRLGDVAKARGRTPIPKPRPSGYPSAGYSGDD